MKKLSFKRFGYSISALLIIFSSIISSTAAFATDGKYDEQFYSNNNITIYNPADTGCSGSGGGALTGPAPTSLTGSTNQQKAWNYFIARGLTPVATAGAMGNIQQESGFQAAVQEHSGGGGLGLIQWTGSRRTNLENAAAKAGVNLNDNDAALLFELNYLWDGEYNAMTWQKQVNAETTVDGNTAIASYNSAYTSQLAASQTGNGSTMVFHALVERSGDTPDMLTTRIKNAEGFLTQFGSGGAGTSCSGSIGAGGLTWDQAVTLGKKIVDNWSANFCGTDVTGGNPGGYCDWTTGYCTAGAAWMATTTAPDPSKVPGIPNGVDVANRLASADSGVYTVANPDGSNLQPFSVWSFGAGSSSGEPGHTGTIVGIGQDGSIITVEVNWAGNQSTATQNFNYTSSNGHRVAVFQYPSFDAFKKSHSGYVYNATATPKDSSIASQMAAKIGAYLGK